MTMVTETDVPIHPTADEAAASIRSHLGKSVEHILAAGQELIAAKANKAIIPHGQWLPFLEKVGIGEKVAYKLMAIAKHPVLANHSHVSDLPPSWSTLYELIQLPDEVLEEKLAGGAINAKTTRKEAEALRKANPKTSAPKGTSEAKPRRPRPRKNTRETEQAIAELVLDEGKTQESAAQELNAGSSSITKVAVAREEGRREMLTELLDAAALKHFTEMGKLRIEDAIRIHKARLTKDFEPRINSEVRRRIAEADDATRKQNKKLRAENLALQRNLSSGAVFTPEQFKKLLMCVHPDNSASVDVRNEVLNLVKTNAGRLVKHDAPRPAPKPRPLVSEAGAQPS